MPKHKFTLEEDAFIKEHYRFGATSYRPEPGEMSASMIGKHLGIQGGSIVTRAHVLKGTKKNGRMVAPPRREPTMPKLKFLGEL